MKISKKLLITAPVLIIAGSIMFGFALKWYSSEYTRDIQNITKEITDNISRMEITAVLDDIEIITGTDNRLIVSYAEVSGIKYDVKSVEGTLKIDAYNNTEDKKWYDYIMNINIHNNDEYKIRVILPQNFNIDMDISSEYGDIDLTGVKGNAHIDAKAGDIEIKDGEFSHIECNLDYGDIEFENVNAKTLQAILNAGDIIMGNIISDEINLINRYGNIEFENISGNISLENNNGDIEGTVLGSEEEYSVNAETRLGDNNLRNKTGGNKKLDVKNDCGDIEVKFVG